MARDFEDLRDLDDLSDDELRALVRERLASHKGIDVNDIQVDVEDGVVRLDGRVGTEAEQRIAERVITDELGVRHVENDLVIDPIRRGESPEAADDSLASDEEQAGLLGDRPVPLEPTADHLNQEMVDEEQQLGTADVQDSTEQGIGWIPPERPTPEGYSGEDARASDMGEDH